MDSRSRKNNHRADLNSRLQKKQFPFCPNGGFKQGYHHHRLIVIGNNVFRTANGKYHDQSHQSHCSAKKQLSWKNITMMIEKKQKYNAIVL